MKTNILDKFKAAPIAVIALAVIYPGIRLLDKWLSQNYIPDPKIDCQVLPAELAGGVFLIEVIVMYIWIALLPKVNSAVFLMLYGSFAMFSIGSFFLLVTHVILFCPPITPQIFNQYPGYLGVFIFFSIIIFMLHLRSRTLKAIELNKKKINFTDMIFSIKEPSIHISSKRSTKSISIISMLAGLIGLGLARLIGESLGEDYKLATLLIVMIFLSYMILGYMLLIQLYSTWIVYKRSKVIGKKMTIKEFNL